MLSNALYFSFTFFFSFDSFCYFRLLVFQIKSHSGVAYKSVVYKKYVTLSSENEEITLPHEFIFVFIWYFTRVILSEKNVKSGGWPYRGVVYRRGGSNLLHTMIQLIRQIHNHFELPPITLKLNQSKGNVTKRHNLAMLPMLCTLEPIFWKIGINFLAQSNKTLYLLSTIEFYHLKTPEIYLY